ncbi:MAG: DUF2283 domain-containing protein [Nanoarchaeota archaeon]
MKNNNFYDEKNDILSLHNGFSDNERLKSNIEAGNIVLDLSDKGNIVGVEIMEASDLFDISELKNIHEIKFEANKNNKWINVNIIIDDFNKRLITIPSEINVIA